MNAITKIRTAALEMLAPPPELTVSEWSDRYRKLSSESSATPGQWHTSIVEYMREPMDMIGRPDVRRLSVMAGAQIAKTEMLLNTCAYCIDYEPSPIMVVQPTLDMAKTFSKDRLAPMLRDTPRLRNKVKDVKSRDSGNTILQKTFNGGHITMVGANSASSLASRPIRVVLFDEVDRFPISAGSEGDPIQLAVARTKTFWNRILIFVSTPTLKALSRIYQEYLQGDQRQRWCKCPDCGEHQVLRWSNIKWDKGSPEDAYYVCEENGCVWDDNKRNKAVRTGEWRAQKPFNGNVSYHITGMMSPFVPMADGVREFLAAKANPETLKVWVNTYLGEPFEDEGERLDYTDLMEQVDEYPAGEVPEEVTLLTCGVDVQDDRFELEVLGWGDDHESWSIDYQVIHGDPSTPAPWVELETALKQVYDHPLFGDLPIRGTCIDTGGHYTAKSYNFTKQLPRVFPIKGVGGEGRPTISRPTRNNIGKVQLFPIGVFPLKELVFARARVKEPGPGYCHFPTGYDVNYFKGFTAEKLIVKFHKGFPKREYIATEFKRNEPLDNRVYATAALEILGVNLNAQRRALLRGIERDKAEATENDAPVKKQKPGRSAQPFATRF